MGGVGVIRMMLDTTHRLLKIICTSNVEIPKVNSEYMGKLSLRYFGPVVWEIMLPESFKTITELQEFKAKIRKWVPTNCICRLCKNIQRFV